MDSNIKSLTPRLERWLPAFESRSVAGTEVDVSVKVSNHGRLLLRINGEHVALPCTDMVQLVQGVVRAMAEHGFPPEPPDPGEPVYMKVR